MPRSTSYPVVGTVKYNGYTFKDPLKAKITAQYIRDASDRTTKFVRYRLEIEFYVFPEDDYVVRSGLTVVGTAGGPTNDNVENLRQCLAYTGGHLQVDNIGFGNNININDPTITGTRLDVAFGPKPSILSWTPIGSDRASKCLWVCEFTIPECLDDYYNQQYDLAEYNYEVSWALNHEGLTTRTVSGILSIPNGRVIGSPGNIRDTADNYRWIVTTHFLPLEGFQRDMNFSLSNDKATLTWTITDTEIPSDYPYPSYIVNIDVEHTVSSHDASSTGNVRIVNGIQWNNTIRGTITVAPGFPKALAWEAFRKIVADRVQLVNITGEQGSQTRLQFVNDLSVSNSLFNRRIRFSIGFYLVSSLDQFFEHSGVFKPVTSNTWGQWSASIAQAGITHPNSVAQLTHLPSDDFIIDLCETTRPTSPSPPFKPYSDGFIFLPTTCPDPQFSWIEFHNSIKLYVLENGRYIHKKLREIDGGTTEVTGWVHDPDLQNLDQQLENDHAAQTPVTQPNANLVQVKGPPTYMVVMEGWARRQCYDVIIPRLVSFGGVRPIRGNHEIHPSVEVFHPTMPIKRAEWRLQYILPSVPTTKGKDDIIVETDGKYSVTRT